VTPPAEYARPAPQPHGYAPPQAYGYAPPQGYAPPPQGYGPFVPAAPPAPPAAGRGLGVIAFVLAVAAAFGTTIVACLAAFRIGIGTGREIALRPMDVDFDWSTLTPVRDWVLIGEVAFWAGTVLGVWAIVQGIVAIVRNRGRGWGVAAVVIGALGPFAFFLGVQAFLVGGFASGASVGG
jgi:hypothetical protein